MVVNPPLILVSALFFLALSSVFYVSAWGIVKATLQIGRGRFSHAANKRLLMLGLMLPPVLALIPTFGGATLHHSHVTPLAEHHSPVCRLMFVHLFSAETMTGTAANASEIAGKIVNGAAWLLLGVGVFFFLRLVWATAKLEDGLEPHLHEPSAALTEALARIGRSLPRLPTSRFFECALPAAYSSVLGLRHVRCVLSRDFVSSATADELDAVVAHEASHLIAHDVSAAFAVGALNCLFFPLRPVQLLARRWHEEAELACDDAAVAATKQPLAMAAAILRAIGAPVPLHGTARPLPTVAMPFADQTASSTPARVERLIAHAKAATLPAAQETTRQIWAGWLTTLTFAGLGLVILLSPEMLCYAHCSLEAVSRLMP